MWPAWWRGGHCPAYCSLFSLESATTQVNGPTLTAGETGVVVSEHSGCLSPRTSRQGSCSSLGFLKPTSLNSRVSPASASPTPHLWTSHCLAGLGPVTTQAEHQRIDAFELWPWRRLLPVPWTARRSNQSILKEINPEYSLEELKLKLQYFGHLMGRADFLGKTLMEATS